MRRDWTETYYESMICLGVVLTPLLFFLGMSMTEDYAGRLDAYQRRKKPAPQGLVGDDE